MIQKLSSFKEDFKEMVRAKSNFRVYVGRGSCCIQNNAGHNVTYVNKARSGAFFGVVKALSKHLDENPYPVRENETFDYSINCLPETDYYKNHISACDISSAYPSVLEIDNMITPAIKSKMDLLPKTEKLSVIGMLAHRKMWRVYIAGEYVEHIQESRPRHAKYFFHCVRRIYNLMEDAQENTDSFLFSWVDCAYFENEKCQKNANDIFAEQGFKFKEKTYTAFASRIVKATHKVNYDNSKDENVQIYVPNTLFVEPEIISIKKEFKY